MADGAVGWMVMVAGLGVLVIGAWLLIGLVYWVVMMASRPSRVVGFAITLLFLPLAAIPPHMAKRYYNELMEDFAGAEAIQDAPVHR